MHWVTSVIVITYRNHRSALYPIFGKRIDGPIGHTVDIAAVLGRFSVLQQPWDRGCSAELWPQSIIRLTKGSRAKWVNSAISDYGRDSATSGVNKGIRVLSELNVLGIWLDFIYLICRRYRVLTQCLSTECGDYINRFGYDPQ